MFARCQLACSAALVMSGNICLKIKKRISILNRQCAAMLAAPIIGHDVKFTLFGVHSFGAFFSQLQITFEDRGWGVGM